MKPLKLFYLRNCPYCKRALTYINEACEAEPALRAVEIELIEESEESALADSYDYYYVPTFYLDGVKIHEGGIWADEVKDVLHKALNE